MNVHSIQMLQLTRNATILFDIFDYMVCVSVEIYKIWQLHIVAYGSSEILIWFGFTISSTEIITPLLKRPIERHNVQCQVLAPSSGDMAGCSSTPPTP